MTRLPLIVAVLILCANTYAQADREVIQSCAFQKIITSGSGEVFLTLCSETDQNSIEINIAGKLSEGDLLSVFDGDDKNALIFPGSQKPMGNLPLIFKSSRLCLTILAKLESSSSSLEINGKCVAIDRSKWPVYQAISK